MSRSSGEVGRKRPILWILRTRNWRQQKEHKPCPRVRFLRCLRSIVFDITPTLSFHGEDRSLQFVQGTSYSSPYWAGAGAFLQSLSPGLTAPQADAIIFDTAAVTDDDWRIPNLEAAVMSLGP